MGRGARAFEAALVCRKARPFHRAGKGLEARAYRLSGFKSAPGQKAQGLLTPQSLNIGHLKRYRDIARLLVRYGRSDLVRSSGKVRLLETTY